MHRVLPASLLVVGMAVAGCSSSTSQGTASPSGGTKPATTIPTATAAATTPATSTTPATQLTGTQLKAMLAPAAWFPSGYSMSKDGAVNTSDQDLPAPAEKNLPCIRLDGTAWIGVSGVTPTAFAQNDYVSPRAGQYAQEIEVYSGASAQQAMTALRSVAARCHRFRDTQTNTKVTVTVVKGPKLGEDALELRLTDPQWAGDTTLEAIRSGTEIITVLYSSPRGSGAAAATKLATYLAGKVASAG